MAAPPGRRRKPRSPYARTSYPHLSRSRVRPVRQLLPGRGRVGSCGGRHQPARFRHRGFARPPASAEQAAARDPGDPPSPGPFQRSVRAGPGQRGAGVCSLQRRPGDRGDRRGETGTVAAHIRCGVAGQDLLPQLAASRPRRGPVRRADLHRPGARPGREPRRQLFPAFLRRASAGCLHRRPGFQRHAPLYRRRPFRQVACGPGCAGRRTRRRRRALPRSRDPGWAGHVRRAASLPPVLPGTCPALVRWPGHGAGACQGRARSGHAGLPSRRPARLDDRPGSGSGGRRASRRPGCPAELIVDLQLKGRRAVVTGSSAGIGEAIARRLAAEGAAVVVHGRRADAVAAVVEAIGSTGGQASGTLANLADPGDCARFISAVLADGGADILVNNAGVFVNRGWDDATPEDWLELYAINVAAAVRCINGFLPAMRAAGWGRIVQIGTGEAINPFPTMPDYAATKAALLNLTVSLAKHLDRTGITVNTVSLASSSPRGWRSSTGWK